MVFGRGPKWWGRWPLVLPGYDGRMCPECGNTIVGKTGRDIHRAWHMARTEYETEVRAVLASIAESDGLRVKDALPEPPDGVYDIGGYIADRYTPGGAVESIGIEDSEHETAAA